MRGRPSIRTWLPATSRGSGTRVRRKNSSSCKYQKIRSFLVAGRELNPRHADFRCLSRGLRHLSINHLQRLADPFPSTPRHNPGTPNLNWSHCWHEAAKVRSLVRPESAPRPPIVSGGFATSHRAIRTELGRRYIPASGRSCRDPPDAVACIIGNQ